MFTRSRLRAVARHLIPNIGTLILLLLFFYVQSVGANPFKSMLSGPADVRISYQGRLTAPDGQPLTGSYEMSFALYTTETGGSSFWSETYDALAVTGGLLNVFLGSATPLPDPLPDGNLYLGITIGGEELSARQPLSSGYHAIGSTYAVNVPDLSINTAQLANNAVTSAKMADNAVGSSEVAANSLTADDLAANSVTNSEVADNAVGSSEVAANSLTADDLAANSVTSSELADNAVGSSEVAANSLTADDLAANSVTNSEMADNAVGSSEVAANSLTADDLAANSVTSSEVAANAVGSSEVAANSLMADDLAANSVTSSEVADNAVGSSEVVANSLTADDLAANSVTASEIADNAVDSGEIASGAVDNGDLASNAVTSAKILDGQVTSADIASNTITESDISDSFKARDADKLDNHDTSYFATASHNHNSQYYTESESNSRFVNTSGNDSMSGSLTIGGGLTTNGFTLRHNGPDFVMSYSPRGDGGRALVHEPNDKLTINHAYDFAGGVRINGLTTAGIVEQNLMTLEQERAISISEFSHGDLLCWDSESEQLQKCAEVASPLVVAVANQNGKPLTFGVEPVKVLGPVKPGDLLVSSNKLGYAVAWSEVASGEPPAGVIIAKALETYEEKQGMIKAMISMQ